MLSKIRKIALRIICPQKGKWLTVYAVAETSSLQAALSQCLITHSDPADWNARLNDDRGTPR